MLRLLPFLLTLCFVFTVPVDAVEDELAPLAESISQLFNNVTPLQWGERVRGVRTQMDTTDRVLALTLDACGSPNGKGADQRLLDFLIREQIPATLFINARWIDANSELFSALVANPLFEIANHGTWHKPASINGRSAYGISGTRDPAELVREIELNARKIHTISGTRPRYYRSGTAFYDEHAVRIAQLLGHAVIGFSVLGDAGATFSARQVTMALLTARPGDIIIAHMNHPESGTADGIIAALPRLKKQGFTFVHLHAYPLR